MRISIGLGRVTAGFAVALLAGCAAFGQSEPVRVTVIGIDALPGESMEVRMAVKLRVQNPNETPVDFDGISLQLDLRGMSFASGVSAEHGSVPRFGESVITVPVSISAFAAVRQALDFAAHEPTAIEYQLRGHLAGTGLGGLRFESHGQVELPRELRQPAGGLQ